MSNIIEDAKRNAAYKAVDEQINASTKVIGIGSGSTIPYAVQRLASLRLPIEACIPTSFQAQQLILKHNLPLATLTQFPMLDVAIDGADEVDPKLNCIKGGGACLLQEKLVSSNAAKFVVVADDRKKTECLGSFWTQGIPVEVIPMAYMAVTRILVESFGLHPNNSVQLRLAGSAKAGPVVTDNGNFILDVKFDCLAVQSNAKPMHLVWLAEDPQKLHLSVIQIPGVVETGLFCGSTGAHVAYFGKLDDASVVTIHKNN